MMDEFMDAVAKRWPRCLVQFEDFRCVGVLGVVLHGLVMTLAHTTCTVPTMHSTFFLGTASGSRASTTTFKGVWPVDG